MGKVTTSLKIDENLWKKTKIEAINQDIQYSEALEEALKDWIKKQKMRWFLEMGKQWDISQKKIAEDIEVLNMGESHITKICEKIEKFSKTRYKENSNEHVLSMTYWISIFH